MQVWLDTDVALGAPRGDVDDAFALAAIARAHAAGRLELLGVSSVFGNTTAAHAARAARALLDAAGCPRIPVVEGAARAAHPTAAARAIAALPDGAALLALGPLTNVAAALTHNPALAVTVSLVGGNLRSRGRHPPLWPFEFNLAKDAPAAHALFASALPRRVYPLDAARALTVGPRWLSSLARRSPLGAHLARGSLRWLAYAPLRYRALAFPVWDAVPALDLLGALPAARHDERRLACVGRGLLAPDDAARPAVCLRAFADDAARAALADLISV